MWAYCPVRKVAREGQQSEKLTKLFWKVAPWAPISEFTFAITRIDSTVWSSVSMTSTLGRASAACARSANAGSISATASTPITASIASNGEGWRSPGAMWLPTTPGLARQGFVYLTLSF